MGLLTRMVASVRVWMLARTARLVVVHPIQIAARAQASEFIAVRVGTVVSPTTQAITAATMGSA